MYALESEVSNRDVMLSPAIPTADVPAYKIGVLTVVPNAPAAPGITSEKVAAIFVPIGWDLPTLGHTWNPSPIVISVLTGFVAEDIEFSAKVRVPVNEEKLRSLLTIAVVVVCPENELVVDVPERELEVPVDELELRITTTVMVVANPMLEYVTVVLMLPPAKVDRNELNVVVVSVDSDIELIVKLLDLVVVLVNVNAVVRLDVWLIVATPVVLLRLRLAAVDVGAPVL